jgi:hypothetical protein
MAATVRTATPRSIAKNFEWDFMGRSGVSG